MFFSTELLSRRDNGFGLLWLAATLGAKSSLKKLPKRSVLTADITQLCKLIEEPPEPMALRLSSNLMVGVVRVYTVKQEILMTDVQTCFNTLKKAVQDLHSIANADATQMQTGQTTLRPDALTLAIPTENSFTLDLDNILANWDATGGPGLTGSDENLEGSNDEHGRPRRGLRDRRSKPQSLSMAEHGRAAPHTLGESHDYLLSKPLDISFADSGPPGVPSSSQYGGAFGFDDGLFTGGDGLDLPGMDDIARELGWDGGEERTSVHGPEDDLIDIQQDSRLDVPVDFQFVDVEQMVPGAFIGLGNPESAMSFKRARDLNKENQPLDPDQSQPPRKKTKRVRLLLDARIELTDDELRSARASYLENQATMRKAMERKQAERNGLKMVEDLLWGAPLGMHAPVLVDFWNEHLKIQVEARTGAIRVHAEANNSQSRHRKPATPLDKDLAAVWEPDFVTSAVGTGKDMFGNFGMAGEMAFDEPELARNISRPPSLIGSVKGRFGSLDRGSQRESVGWEAPAASSSVMGGTFDPGDFGTADVALLSRSASGRRRSSVLSGTFGSGVGASPAHADFGMPSTQMLAEDFGFALPGTQSAVDSQASDVNLAALERNSLDFAKMQLRSMPVGGTMSFDEIVPKSICTAHIASSVFYHCLVLATKDLVSVEQMVAYGPIKLTKKDHPIIPL